MADYRTIKAEPLTNVIRAIAKAGGSSDREADLVSTNLVEANLKGHDSHGVGMIPRYAEGVAEGGLAVNQHVKIVMDTGPLLTLDGLTGYGQVMGYEAMELGAERAKRNGVCVVGLSNSHHIGRIGHWAEQCIDHGLVSIHFVNVISRPIVAPWGGSDARHGTNPFCVGIPRKGKEPIVLDFATSKIAQGKTRVAYNKGVELEPGTIIDNEGKPTTNPRYTVIAPHGAILPFGEHKGSGLALVCEILGGALSGGETVKGPDDGKRRVLNGMLSIIIDPNKLGTGENLAREVESFVAWHTGSPPGPGVDRVKIAGEPERETKKKRLAEGIQVDPNTWQEILHAGKRFGLDQATIEKIAG
ncbi:malate/lactate/ureidoglycolate dehydrogenase [Bradyrhizobium sp. AS23.2]|uniref:malate/lactate/ureidoglycolate dehydrogenase n=1 Tax=Bradyrhizobium sp. AS23.2 TaxID=1680155 RepID=UPI00093D8DEE|nr:malate/lactate/ureidoglycolate dehydrogenase [Bradyrhizobium sp. AS23.2]OKO79363.1 dehydrogenase [Bradyrhizobium sp. AS23.2]